AEASLRVEPETPEAYLAPPELESGRVEERNLHRNSRLPRAAVEVDAEKSGWRLVSVRRKPGESYALHHFPGRASQQAVEGEGEHVLTVLPAGVPGDDFDVTALLTERPRDGGQERVVAASALDLSPQTVWQRHGNLGNTVTLYLRARAGRYAVATQGVDCEITIGPAVPGSDMQMPPPQRGSGTWTLDEGYHQLTLKPRNQGKGILTLTIRGETAAAEAVEAPPLPGATFGPLMLGQNKRHTLYLSDNGTAGSGLAQRRLPADLAAGELPLTLPPGGGLTLPATVPNQGALEALTSEGASLPLTVGKQPPTPRPVVPKGQHTVTLTNPTAQPVQTALRFVPPEPAAAAPLPALPPEALRTLPVFAPLSESQPQFLDLGRNQSRVLALTVAEPSLYRIESTGLLATSGTLRTRVQPSLDQRTGNGYGRNFLLQDYLRPGLYQLSVATQGQTAGHLGVRVAKSPLREGGTLPPGIPARTTMAA
ncbi:MAG: hypothetical protein K2Q10_11515, partial [Rhodospirillales bacterium]|nr:hypothetical protein [Rhodospirillales bacterium]